MNIVWVHRYGQQFASFRYRAATPAVEVAKINGYKTAINSGEADIVIFSKPHEYELEMAQKAKAEGAKIVVDISDDHFMRDDVQKRFAELADGIVTGTDTMRARIYDYTKKDSVAIPDPYEFAECEPHADGDDYLWFGHSSNFNALVRVMPSMKGRKLRVVTGPKNAAGTILWTPENMVTAFQMSNIVVLPTLLGHEFKTNNRLVNSIRSGCFAVCMGHPAYMEFKRHVWVGNFPTGLRWAEHFRKDLNGLVKSAQDYIRDRYSPEAIGRLWASYLGSL